MIYQRERMQDLWDEFAPLFALHHAESAHFKDIPLDPDKAMYEAMENAGAVRCFTVRDGRLIGYLIFKVWTSLHSRSSKQAVHDVLFVLPEFRKRTVGYRLIEFADRELKAEGVQAGFHAVHKDHDYSPILKHQGYELVDHMWAKRLDKE